MDMKGTMNDAMAALRTEEGATAVGAGVITAAAGTAMVYFGGKAAVATAATVGGLLCATAVTFAATQSGLKLGLRTYDWLQRSLAKRPEPTTKVREPKAAAA